MKDVELCKKFAELEGVELVESFGKIHDTSKIGKYSSEYNPITDLALNCAARDKYEVAINYNIKFCHIKIFKFTNRYCLKVYKQTKVEFKSKKDIGLAIIECILKSKGIL